jgi:ribosome-associated protein
VRAAGAEGLAAAGAAAAELAQEPAAEAAEAEEPAAARTRGDSRDWALLAARAADGKKAADIIVQEMRRALPITDYFVIATGANNRQVDAITEAVEEALRKEAGIRPIGREGTGEQTWVLLDYGDIVVHVFQPELREFYRLESLWSDAPLVDLAEAGITQPEYSERVAKLVTHQAALHTKARDGQP